jgi:hypothetical protein
VSDKKSEFEQLKKANRILKEENRQLRNRLKRQKSNIRLKEPRKREEFKQDEPRIKILCSRCQVGEIYYFDLGNKRVFRCGTCEFRETKKI